jgi:hypothetical protein
LRLAVVRLHHNGIIVILLVLPSIWIGAWIIRIFIIIIVILIADVAFFRAVNALVAGVVDVVVFGFFKSRFILFGLLTSCR